MTASLSPSSPLKEADPPSRPTVSRTNSSNLKSKSWINESPVATAAGDEPASQCTFGSSPPAQPAPHPLQALLLRPASWSEESLDDTSDDEWPGQAQPGESGKGKATPDAPALTTPSPGTPPKRPAGSITGIFSREVHLWAASPMFPAPQPVQPHAAGPSAATPVKAARTEMATDEQMSESDVAEWDSAPGGSSVHSVPPSEDEESAGEPMDVDHDQEPAPIKTAPVTPLRRSRRLRSATKRGHAKSASGKGDTTSTEDQNEESEAQEVVHLLITPEETNAQASTSASTSIATALEDTTPTKSPRSKEGGTPKSDAPKGVGKNDALTAQQEEVAVAPTRRARKSSSGSRQDEVQIVRKEENSRVYVSADAEPASPEAPAVMMFGRRSSPARAVPLDRFSRSSKGKIACTWSAPPGHRPCMRSFTRRADLDRHIATVHQMLNVACAKCGATFSRQDALTRHQRDSCAALFSH